MKKLITIALALSLFACKKNVNETLETPVTIEKETRNWFKGIKSTLSGALLKLTTERFNALDYAHAKAIKQENHETTFFFVKINDRDSKFDEYLSFAKTDKGFQTIGFVKVTETSIEDELADITGFINKGRISKDFRLSFYGLDNKHFSSYEGLANGGLKTLSVESGKTLRKGRINSGLKTGTLSGCIDWYMVTTYTYSNGTQYQTEEYLGTTCEAGSDCQLNDPYGQSLECLNSGDGNGWSPWLNPYANNYPDDGKLSCSSFIFRTMTSNMYEAGVSGLKFVLDIAGGGSITHNFRDVFVGFPSSTATNVSYTEGEAAAITAYAMNKAGTTMSITYFGMSTIQASLVTTAQLEVEFKTLVQLYINQEINAGSTVSFSQSGGMTVTKTAVWNNAIEQFWNGLTGSGCK